MDDFQKRLAERTSATGRNMHETTSGGGAIAAGDAYGRMVGYVECGVQLRAFQGVLSDQDTVTIVYELSGASWPERDGRLPLIREQHRNSDNQRANISKRMKTLDPEGKFTHMAQMLDRVFFVKVETTERNGRSYSDVKEVSLAQFKDPRSGKIEDVSGDADPRAAKLMFFLWDTPTLAEWDDLFIEGTYDDGGTRNAYQNLIRGAQNFEGSPIHKLLVADGREPYADYPGGQDELEGSEARNRAAIKRRNDAIRRSGGDASVAPAQDNAPARQSRPTRPAR